jgi:hypothetical protein
VGPDPALGHRLREPASKSGNWPAPTLSRQAGALVLGGGVAGLSALRRLVARGVADAQLLESHTRVGGNALGHQLAGIACPQGAHYLPLPGPDAPEVADWLASIGLLRPGPGGWVPNERHLCHAPQERLFIDGAWQTGLLPSAEDRPATLAQYRRFSQQVDAQRRARRFAMPSTRRPWSPELAQLDATPFSHWLAAQGLDDPRLLGHLDYCCRDDYGAGLDAVSAWAGLHYFASRHGFQLPGDTAEDEREPVFTWPEGNAWLVDALARPLAERLHTGCLALRIEPAPRAGALHRVWVWQQGADGGGLLALWHTPTLVLALPLFMAQRLLAGWPHPLAAALAQAAQVPHAPWLVANLHFEAPLLPGPGAPPSWDNVPFHPAGSARPLGWVDAMHQSFRPHPGPTVLTLYQALPPGRRAELLSRPPQAWAAELLAELAATQPDAPARVRHIDLTRWGHAMATPAPGVRSVPALAALRQESQRPDARIRFAHADLVGYSVFEEAFTAGWTAGG